jgi:tetratricopeptide (TPR) repeat protein
MTIFDWLKNRFSSRAKFISLYRNGMSKAKKGDFAGAVLDYTSAIDAAGISNDVLGMALYNRALAYSAIDESDKAAEDLTRALKIPGLPENIKVAAIQRQERIRRREA